MMKPATGERVMANWFWLAVVAAVLYGLHQVFTRLAADRIGDGVGGFIVEASAAVSILGYLAYLKATQHWTQPITSAGITWSILAGVCVGAGPSAFFQLYQRGGPLTAVPMVLAGGAAIMAAVGFIAFREPVTRQRVIGIVLSIAGLYLLRK
jgi:transporter family protein